MPATLKARLPSTGAAKPISAFWLMMRGTGAPLPSTVSQSGFAALIFVSCGMKFLSAAKPDWLTVLGSGAPVPLIINQKAEIGFAAPVLGNLAFSVAGRAPRLRLAGPNPQRP